MFLEENLDGFLIQIPVTFSGYRVVSTLGRGLFACVLLVESIKTNEKFACKVISREKMERENLIIRLEEELRILEHIKHPSIVEIHKIIYQEKLIMVIQEYCSGGEMFLKVTSGPNLRESDILRYSLQIISAINYLHTRNIMQRDIKLENIVLDNKGDAKIIDFGLSEVVNNVNLKTLCGTLIYMAPEMLSQREFDGKAVDIWAIGICIYAMVTRTFPWKSTTDEELLHEIIQADIFFPNFVCPTISELLHRTLAKNPTERASASELISIISKSSVPRGISKYASKTHYIDEILLVKRKKNPPAKILIKPHKSIDIPFFRYPKQMSKGLTFDNSMP